jgi:hypothetical protein
MRATERRDDIPAKIVDVAPEEQMMAIWQGLVRRAQR